MGHKISVVKIGKETIFSQVLRGVESVLRTDGDRWSLSVSKQA